MNRKERIEAALRAAFNPLALSVEDDSARHAGHVGVAGRDEAGGHAGFGGQTHYTVAMSAAMFSGMNRVARSRAVHDALAAEFADGLHALALRLRAPEE